MYTTDYSKLIKPTTQNWDKQNAEQWQKKKPLETELILVVEWLTNRELESISWMLNELESISRMLNI